MTDSQATDQYVVDIVSRLRMFSPFESPLMHECADEIERLRRDLRIQTVNATAVLQAQHERDCAVEDVKRLAVEIERIATDCPMSAGTRTRLRKLITPAGDVPDTTPKCAECGQPGCHPNEH